MSSDRKKINWLGLIFEVIKVVASFIAGASVGDVL